MLEELFVDIVGTDPVTQGLAGGIFIAFMNLVGASVVLIWREPTERWLDAALGFAAGVMLSASFTSLLVPGIEFASTPEYDAIRFGWFALTGIVPVLIGFFLGAFVLDHGDDWVRYVGPIVSNRLTTEAGTRTDGGENEQGHFTSPSSTDSSNTRVLSVLLFTAAITLHNMPEALSVGVGFGSGNISQGIALMLAIGMQNIPEGLAVSVAALSVGLGSRWYATVVGIRAGLVEVPLALVGAWAVTVAAPLLPYAMGFAAGGMLYVIVDEIIPQTHSRGHERVATLGLMIGAAVMLTLDVILA